MIHINLSLLPGHGIFAVQTQGKGDSVLVFLDGGHVMSVTGTYTEEAQGLRVRRQYLMRNGSNASMEQTFYHQVRVISKGTFTVGPVGADAMYQGEDRRYAVGRKVVQ